jgi:hypothetical protein
VQTNDRAVTVLTPSECLDLLSLASLGRISISIDALPAIVPVQFMLLDGSVIFRPVGGGTTASHGMVVAFQADQLLAPQPPWWSVTLQGVAHLVLDPDELIGAQSAPEGAWVGGSDAGHWARIEPGTMSGRRFG